MGANTATMIRTASWSSQRRSSGPFPRHEEAERRTSVVEPDSTEVGLGMDSMGVSDGFRPQVLDATREEASHVDSDQDAPLGSVDPPTAGPSSPNQSSNRSWFIAQSPRNSLGPRRASQHRNVDSHKSDGGGGGGSNNRGDSSPVLTSPVTTSNPQPRSKADTAGSNDAIPVGVSTLGGPAPTGPDPGLRIPQHPYALYPQNIVPEDSSTLPALNIPVGFSQMGNLFQPQASAREGETQAIVGPDGHVEELPPYTRYPDHRPAGPGVVPERPPPEPPTSPAIVDVTNESATTLDHINQSQSRISTRSNLSDTSRGRLTVPAPSHRQEVVGEKDQKPKLKRFWHGKVPIWVVAVIVVFIALGVVLAAGVTMGVRKLKEKSNPSGIEPTNALP